MKKNLKNYKTGIESQSDLYNDNNSALQSQNPLHLWGLMRPSFRQ